MLSLSSPPPPRRPLDPAVITGPRHLTVLLDHHRASSAFPTCINALYALLFTACSHARSPTLDIGFAESTGKETPKSLSREHQEAANEMLKEQRSDPLTGISSAGYKGKGAWLVPSSSGGLEGDEDAGGGRASTLAPRPRVLNPSRPY